jgi:hypothetical protein
LQATPERLVRSSLNFVAFLAKGLWRFTNRSSTGVRVAIMLAGGVRKDKTGIMGL